NADNTCSVTGGYVYRGDAIPALRGHYFYSDFCAGWIRSFRLAGDSVTDEQEWNVGDIGNVLSFGEDAASELYVLTRGSAGGRVFRFVTADASWTATRHERSRPGPPLPPATHSRPRGREPPPPREGAGKRRSSPARAAARVPLAPPAARRSPPLPRSRPSPASCRARGSSAAAPSSAHRCRALPRTSGRS